MEEVEEVGSDGEKRIVKVKVQVVEVVGADGVKRRVKTQIGPSVTLKKPYKIPKSPIPMIKNI